MDFLNLLNWRIVEKNSGTHQSIKRGAARRTADLYLHFKRKREFI